MVLKLFFSYALNPAALSERGFRLGCLITCVPRGSSDVYWVQTMCQALLGSKGHNTKMKNWWLPPRRLLRERTPRSQVAVSPDSRSRCIWHHFIKSFGYLHLFCIWLRLSNLLLIIDFSLFIDPVKTAGAYVGFCLEWEVSFHWVAS